MNTRIDDVIKVVIGEYGFIFKTNFPKTHDFHGDDEDEYLLGTLLLRISQLIQVPHTSIVLLTRSGEKPSLKNLEQQRTLFLFFKSKHRIKDYILFSYDRFSKLGIELEKDQITRKQKRLTFFMERVTCQKSSLSSLMNNRNRYFRMEESTMKFIRESERFLKNITRILSEQLPQQIEEYENDFFQFRSSQKSSPLSKGDIEGFKKEIAQESKEIEELNRLQRSLSRNNFDGRLKRLQTPDPQNDLTQYSSIMELNRQTLVHNFGVIEAQQKRVFKAYKFKKRVLLLHNKTTLKRLQFLSFLLSPAQPILEDERFGRPKNSDEQEGWDFLEDDEEEEEEKEEKKTSPRKGNNNERMIDIIQRSFLLTNLFHPQIIKYFPNWFSDVLIKHQFLKPSKPTFQNPFIDNLLLTINSKSEEEDATNPFLTKKKQLDKKKEEETELLQIVEQKEIGKNLRFELERERGRNKDLSRKLQMNERNLFQFKTTQLQTLERKLEKKEDEIRSLLKGNLIQQQKQQQLLRQKYEKEKLEVYKAMKEKDQTIQTLKQIMEEQLVQEQNRLEHEKRKAMETKQQQQQQQQKNDEIIDQLQRDNEKFQLTQNQLLRKQTKDVSLIKKLKLEVKKKMNRVVELEESKIQLLETQGQKIQELNQKARKSFMQIMVKLKESENHNEKLEEYIKKLRRKEIEKEREDKDINENVGRMDIHELRDNLRRSSEQNRVLEGKNEMIVQKLGQKDVDIQKLRKYIRKLQKRMIESNKE